MKRTPPPIQGRCDYHDKIAYNSRGLAKAVIRRMSTRKGMREYPCDRIPGCWHVGHFPPVVREGRKTAAEVYR